MAESIQDRSLAEHPDDLRERLEASGDWPAAKEILESTRQRYYHKFRKAAKSSGAKGISTNQSIEANKAAWDAVIDRFPSPPDVRPLESLATFLKTKRPVRRKTAAMPELTPEADERFDTINDAGEALDAVHWVYRNLSALDPNPMECPNRGAWDLLGLARDDKRWFFEKYYKPLVLDPKRKQGEEETEPDKAERLAIAELEQLIADVTSRTVAEFQEFLNSK